MQIDEIKQPFKDKILEILKSEGNSDSRLIKLKMYMLNEDYFKSFNVDAAWLAYEINKNYSS
jgi:hypothetical protein|tara:strand:- start:648 stop:833 length:186 start_codon:yes stop_codon:yes gene_type:complete